MRGGKAEHLLEWVVLGHDRENRLQRLVGDVRLRPRNDPDALVLEVLCGALDIVTTLSRALFHLGSGLIDQLPHLLCDQWCELLDILFENVRSRGE